MQAKFSISPADFVRRLILGWLMAVMLEYLRLPVALRELSGLEGLRQMSFLRVLALTVAFAALLWLVSRFVKTQRAERWAVMGAMAILAFLAVSASYSVPFLILCLLAVAVLEVYALFGWDNSREMTAPRKSAHPIYVGLTAGFALAFFAFVSVWTVCRVYSLNTPTFDFGIFSQMFYNMKESGLPMTTVERDGLLSHFDVHMSPIYYLMLPFYCIAPRPETLQVLQAAVMTSAVIPLWKIGKNYGLSGLIRMLLCGLLLLYPAFSGGVGYDVHENCFLTPLILWLLYGIDRKNIAVTAISGVLTLLVKEDAAVYVGIIALYLLVRSALRRKKGEWWGLVAGGTMLLGAVVYFFAVTGYLAENGDGVMTYRYNNFIFDDSASLVTVIKAVVMNPMKALFECVDEGKLKFIGQTMVPLLGLPLLTRRFERYILLIPYVLINLMSDYQYQHDIFFQYTFGSTACLMYLVAVNLADLRISWCRVGVLAAAVAVSIGFFTALNVPKAKVYPEYCVTYAGYYREVRSVLDQIPDGASVAATTYYTTYLSQREVLYDVQYCTAEHLLSTEYIALHIGSTSNFKKYGGYENLVALLEENGYVLYAERPGTVTVWHKTQTE